MVIDDQRFGVEKGSVVRVAPQAKRAWWNTGDEPLYYVVIQSHSGSLQAAGLEDGEIIQEAVPWT